MGLILKSRSDEIVKKISHMSRVYREGGSMRIISYHFYLELTTSNRRSLIPYINYLIQIIKITKQES